MSNPVETTRFTILILSPTPLVLPNLAPLKDAITNTPPFCSGTLDVDEDNFLFFYKTRDKSRTGCIDFSDTSEAELEALVDACDVATFGLNSEDVLDTNYRRAWKMDSKYFASKLDLVETGLLGIIRARLLEGPNEKKQVKAEMYKLNVYGKESFFKTHQDTPRSANMFGSLVVVFPTAHQGGSLLLNHHGEKWEFDSSKAFTDYGKPCIGYVALFSDVEHEVTKVESGHRVTLTYNLYFTEDQIPSEVPPVVPDLQKFKIALSDALSDASFLPRGGLLGFGLRFMYPVDHTRNWREPEPLEELLGKLKGSDAIVRQACRDLSLNISAKAIYIDPAYIEDSEGKEKLVNLLVMSHRVVNFSGRQVDDSLTDALCDNNAAEVIHDAAKPESRELKESRGVHWVTPLTTFSPVKSDYVAYGNQGSVDHFYGNICLVVRIGPVGARSEDVPVLESEDQEGESAAE